MIEGGVFLPKEEFNPNVSFQCFWNVFPAWKMPKHRESESNNSNLKLDAEDSNTTIILHQFLGNLLSTLPITPRNWKYDSKID